MNFFTDAGTTVSFVERIASVSVLISCLELLAQPNQFSDGGLMNWSVSQLRYKWLSAGPLAGIFNFLFSYPAILYLILIRLLSALFLVTGWISGTPQIVLTVIVAITSIGLVMRNPYGQDGADQMSAITFVGLVLVHLSPHPAVEKTFLWFMALQVCLSYVTAGLAKAVSTVWRNGKALPGICGTKAYGHPLVAAYLNKHPTFCVALSIGLIFFECSFPLVFIVPMPLAVLFLIAGTIFHATAALLMGLNTFFWSFTATYPAIIYCVHHNPSI